MNFFYHTNFLYAKFLYMTYAYIIFYDIFTKGVAINVYII